MDEEIDSDQQEDSKSLQEYGVSQDIYKESNKINNNNNFTNNNNS